MSGKDWADFSPQVLDVHMSHASLGMRGREHSEATAGSKQI